VDQDTAEFYRYDYFIETGFLFMNDMWEYDIQANSWSKVEAYGISSITRHLYLWSGESIFYDIETYEMLEDDLEYAQTRQSQNQFQDENFNIELPQPRGGHSMAIVGNPQDYIIIFGGSSYLNVTDT